MSFISNEVGWVVRTFPSEMSRSFLGHSSEMVVESFELSPTMVDKLFGHSSMKVDELFELSLGNG